MIRVRLQEFTGKSFLAYGCLLVNSESWVQPKNRGNTFKLKPWAVPQADFAPFFFRKIIEKRVKRIIMKVWNPSFLSLLYIFIPICLLLFFLLQKVGILAGRTFLPYVVYIPFLEGTLPPVLSVCNIKTCNQVLFFSRKKKRGQNPPFFKYKNAERKKSSFRGNGVILF